ncbi:sortase B protein-sorting domain-containing protein [Bacillus sp. JCM 19041]
MQNAQTLDTNLISLYVALFVASGAYLIWRRRRVRLVD